VIKMLCFICNRNETLADSIICFECDRKTIPQHRYKYKRIRRLVDSMSSGWFTVAELSQSSGFTKSTVISWLKLLEKKGWVERKMAVKKKICTVWRLQRF